jgi:secreted Zn-dependent insulinase-like peptidase
LIRVIRTSNSLNTKLILISDTEYQERKHEVEQQIEQFIVEMGNYSHPVSNFNWGNLQTLQDDISDEDLYEKLHEFRQKYYLANRMHLCIQSRLGLNELQDLVLQYFTDIPYNFEAKLDLASFGTYNHKNAFKTIFYDKMACVKVKSEDTRLFLTWVLPPMLDKYRSKPLHFVQNILLSEDSGTLLDYLTEK